MTRKANLKSLDMAALSMGILPMVAAASSFATSFWLALSLLILAALARVVGPTTQKLAGERMTAFLLSLSMLAIVSIILSILEVVDPQPALAMGIYLPLSCVGGFLARDAQALAKGDAPRPQIYAIASAILIIIVGGLREFLGTSRLSLPLGWGGVSFPVPGKLSMGLLENPAGALIILGFLTALSRLLSSRWKENDE